MIRRPPRSTHCISSAASDVYKRQELQLCCRIWSKLFCSELVFENASVICRQLIWRCLWRLFNFPWTIWLFRWPRYPVNDAPVVMVTPASSSCNDLPLEMFTECNHVHHCRCWIRCWVKGIIFSKSWELGFQKLSKCSWMGLIYRRALGMRLIQEATIPNHWRKSLAVLWPWINILVVWINFISLSWEGSTILFE